MHAWPVDASMFTIKDRLSKQSQVSYVQALFENASHSRADPNKFPCVISSREHIPAAVSLPVRLQGAPLAHMSNSDQNVVREVVTDSQRIDLLKSCDGLEVQAR